VIDADALARDAQAPGSAVLAAIARRFGGGVVSRTGPSIAPDCGPRSSATKPPSRRHAIVHPAVQQRRSSCSGRRVSGGMLSS